MPFLESYPLRAQGPRTDLSVAYLNATINDTTVTVNASETTAGYSLSRTGVGAYTITFKKCRYAQIIPVYCPVAAAGNRTPFVLAGFDPNAGTASLVLAAPGDGVTPTEPTAAANELCLRFLSGF